MNFDKESNPNLGHFSFSFEGVGGGGGLEGAGAGESAIKLWTCRHL